MFRLNDVSRFRLSQLWYAPVLALAMGLMFIRLLVFARLLDVNAFALYSAGLLVSSSFLMLGCLGLQSLLQRELPVMIVRRRESAGGILLMQCALVAVGCAALGTGVVVVGGVSLAGLSPAMVVLSLIHGLSLQTFLVATVESRSRGQTLRFAQQNLGRAVLLLLAGSAAAVLSAHPTSVLATEAACSLFLSAGLFRQQFYAIPMRLATAAALAWRRLRFTAWRSALTLLAVSSISFLVISADRWIAAELLPVSAFAQYAFAWTVLMVAQSVQALINSSLFTLLSRRFASHGAVFTFGTSAKASFGILVCGTLAALPLWLVLDYSVDRWFVAYHEARGLLPIFLVISVLRLSDFWSSYLVVVGCETQLLVLNLFGAVVAVVAWWFCVKPTDGVLTTSHVALLALLLAITGYAVVASAAWHYSWTFRKVAA